jgi:hypothetical protein
VCRNFLHNQASTCRAVSALPDLLRFLHAHSVVTRGSDKRQRAWPDVKGHPQKQHWTS